VTARRTRREDRPPRPLQVRPDAPPAAGPGTAPAQPPGAATLAMPATLGGRGGAGQRTRVRKARRASLLGCGHHVRVGDLIVSYSRGPWQCITCSLARIRAGGQRPRRGAHSIEAALEDERRRE